MSISIRFFAGILLVGPCLVHAQYEATLIESSQAWGTAIADYNGDGHDDIFITGHDNNDRIWYWTPTGYKPSAQVLVHTDRHDCDAADVNRDGLMDFYCAVGAKQGTGSKPKELWLQAPDGRHYKSLGFGGEDPYGRGRLPLFFDLNRDGNPDLYVANQSEPRPDGQPNINRVYVNQAGTGVFAEVTTLATGDRGYQCLAKGDIDGDGWDDLVLCSENSPGHLYVNTRTSDFQDLQAPAVAQWVDAKLSDVNGDGRDDLVVITASNAFQIWLNTGGGSFYETVTFQEQLPGRAVSLAAADFNRDGRKDIYVVLRDELCGNTRRDLVPDWVYFGRAAGGWKKTVLPQDYAGCGRMADVVDGDKVLLVNGGGDYVGPNYLLGASTSSGGKAEE